MNDRTDLVSEVTRATIAVVVIGGYVVMAFTGRTIPESFAPIVAGVVGFFFGSGGAAAGLRALRAH